MPAGMQMADTPAAVAPQPDTRPKPAEPATPPPAAAEHKGHAGHGGSSSPMSSDMAEEMGHGGNMDLPAMVRDMRNRFWICFVFAVPIFIYSPMGNMFPAPAPPMATERAGSSPPFSWPNNRPVSGL